VRKTFLVGALLWVVAGAAWAQSEGDPQAGERKATTCIGCHGVAGYKNGYPAYRVPRVAGQNAPYIVSALQAYKAGKRSHPTMKAQAAQLSTQDMKDIAAYFAQQGDAP